MPSDKLHLATPLWLLKGNPCDVFYHFISPLVNSHCANFLMLLDAWRRSGKASLVLRLSKSLDHCRAFSHWLRAWGDRPAQSSHEASLWNTKTTVRRRVEHFLPTIWKDHLNSPESAQIIHLFHTSAKYCQQMIQKLLITVSRRQWSIFISNSMLSRLEQNLGFFTLFKIASHETKETRRS